MAHTHHQQQEENKENDGDSPTSYRRFHDDLITGLPSDDGEWGYGFRQYRRFWYPELFLPLILSINDTFKARPSDILLVSQPKSGTIWLKALAFSILNRHLHPPSAQHHPLLTSNPHQCVPFLTSLYDDQTLQPVDATLDSLPSPRLIALHNSYYSLPASVHESGCKIIYLARDPKDTLVSHYRFFETIRTDGFNLSFDRAFELFCSGVSFYGPVWEHQLEYWHNSMKQHAIVMFLKYEEMMADTAGHVKLLAEFMGCGFDSSEVRVAEEIVRLCSFERLSNAKVNKEGEFVVSASQGTSVRNSSFFRKGKVGDWRNHMSIEMARRMDKITKEKFEGSSLSFPSSRNLMGV